MINNKLNSTNGASITFALLLFLVCAVVSSVVITAGTAASGRMSGAVDSDLRFYSVTSAAKMIKEKLDGQSVVVEFKKDDKGEIDLNSVAYSIRDKNGKEPKENDKPSKSLILDASVPVNKFINDRINNTITNNTYIDNTIFTILDIIPNNAKYNNLCCKAKESITIHEMTEHEMTDSTESNVTGNQFDLELTFDVYNNALDEYNNPLKSNGQFTMRVMFTGSVEDIENKNISIDEYNNTITTIMISRTIAWNFHSFQIVGAVAST